ncbi:MAG: alpha/beta hydrolase [Pseudomonadota bacterium]
MLRISNFEDHIEILNGTRIAWTDGGDGPPLLLLHGFPQTRALWAEIAPELAREYRVICPDLRGYGQSGKPGDVSEYSFRMMAQDQLALMRHLGFEDFRVAGHDRGARVAHRLALDAPEAVTRMALMDIVPTHTLLSQLRRDVAQAYYHWFFLAQPEPFPENMIGEDPDAYFMSCLLGWGAARLEDFTPAQLEAYRAAWRDADAIRGMCNDYRATLAHDFEDDAADLGAQIPCPTMVLYGADGAMGRMYDMEAVWAEKCSDMRVLGLPGGHFFPDTAPSETTEALRGFFRATQS